MREGSIKYNGGRIGIVAGRFNDDITDALLTGAMHALAKYGVPDGANGNLEVVRVPGAFEIPLVAQKLFRGELGEPCDVVIALGVIIKGDTEHYEYVCKETADGIMRVQLDEGKPIIFEVLMVDDVAKARERSVVPQSVAGEPIKESHEWMKNKGYVAALNALEIMNL